MDLVTGGPLSTYRPPLSDYEASTGEITGAYFQDAIDFNPAFMAGRQVSYWLADVAARNPRNRETLFLDRDEANRIVSERGLKFDVPEEGITKYELETKLWLQERERRRAQTLQRPSRWYDTALGFGAALGGSAIDPINVASAFIPVVREARAAAWLARTSTVTERALVRAGIGALEGTAGAALVEPLVYFGAQAEQLDYDLADSFANVVLGGVLGAGLHTVGGAVYDRFVPWRREAVEAPDALRSDVLQGAVQSLEEGRPVRAAEQFETDSRRPLREGETIAPPITAERAGTIPIEDIDYAREVVRLARGETDEATAGGDILSAIRSLGGVSLRDANGQMTREGGELAVVMQDARLPPGVINNRTGMRPDYMREALAQDGWFGVGRDAGEVDIQDFYDLFGRAAQGERVTRAEDGPRSAYGKKEAQADLTAAGISAADSPDVAAGKLARHYDNLKRQKPERPPREPGEDDLSDADYWDATGRENAERSQVVGEDSIAVDEEIASLQEQIDAAMKREVLTDADIAALNAMDEFDALAEREKKIVRAAAMCLAEAAE